MSPRIRITLSDDHPIVLAGLRNLLTAENDMRLMGEAPDGAAALKLIRDVKPDIAILDISMPGLNGLGVVRRLNGELPGVRWLLLTVHEDRAYLNQALAAGVSGYLLKRSAAENLVPAIRAVFVGGLYVDPAIADYVTDTNAARRGGSGRKSATAELTDREAEVLKLTALGFTNKETASRLDVGVKSVETYKARGLEKLGLRTRAELVRFASVQGWLAER